MRLGLSKFTSHGALDWSAWLDWLAAPRDPPIFVLLGLVVLLIALGRRNSGLAPRS